MTYSELKPLVAELMRNESRNNSFKDSNYWYPLAMATYDESEVMEALESMCSFRTTMWEKTRRFEEMFGDLHQSEAVMVNSGSSADLLSSFLLHERSGGPLRSGDEVLVPAVTWPTQVWSLAMAGFVPKFIDVDPQTLNVDLADLERRISPQTRAVALVHLMGNSSRMDDLMTICRRHNLELIEDCCEALGTESNGQRVGTFGQTGTFSFFFSHHITTMEGGMVITRDEDLADKLRLLRAHGWSRNSRKHVSAVAGIDSRYTFLSWGFNVRPTELQAGFGLVQLTRLDQFATMRQLNASRLSAVFSSFSSTLHPMAITPGVKCSWFTYPILLDERCPFSRDDLTQFLESRGVETRPIVAGNLARQPAMDRFPELQGDLLPGADYVHDNGFYLGIHPVDFGSQIDRLGELLDSFHRSL